MLINRNVKKQIIANACGLHHIGIKSKCLGLSNAFYISLGFENVSGDLGHVNVEKMAILKLKNLCLEIREAKVNRGTGSVDHFSIDVENVDYVFRAIKQNSWYYNGAQYQYVLYDDHIHSQTIRGIVTRSFYIRGPNSEKIEFCQTL